jgi:hypothetical protein
MSLALWVFFGLALAAWAGVYGYRRLQRARGADLRCHCPNCNGRLAYSTAQAGHMVMCPKCCRRFALPGKLQIPAPISTTGPRSGVLVQRKSRPAP